MRHVYRSMCTQAARKIFTRKGVSAKRESKWPNYAGP
jgi:hypothetical protein